MNHFGSGPKIFILSREIVSWLSNKKKKPPADIHKLFLMLIGDKSIWSFATCNFLSELSSAVVQLSFFFLELYDWKCSEALWQPI